MSLVCRICLLRSHPSSRTTSCIPRCWRDKPRRLCSTHRTPQQQTRSAASMGYVPQGQKSPCRPHETTVSEKGRGLLTPATLSCTSRRRTTLWYNLNQWNIVPLDQKGMSLPLCTSFRRYHCNLAHRRTVLRHPTSGRWSFHICWWYSLRRRCIARPRRPGTARSYDRTPRLRSRNQRCTAHRVQTPHTCRRCRTGSTHSRRPNRTSRQRRRHICAYRSKSRIHSRSLAVQARRHSWLGCVAEGANSKLVAPECGSV